MEELTYWGSLVSQNSNMYRPTSVLRCDKAMFHGSYACPGVDESHQLFWSQVVAEQNHLAAWTCLEHPVQAHVD